VLKIKRAKEQFDFYTILHLFQLTSRKAENLEQLLGGIEELPGSVIYHHTHLYLQQHLYLSPEPPNDFAYWVAEVLQEPTLGEKLESIDTCQFKTIRSLREKIISTIKEYLEEQKGKSLREVPEGQEFHFIRTISFILPTGYQAWDLLEFIEILNKISIHSIYFHVFESRIRLEKGINDFSNWISTNLGYNDLAQEIAGLDPYTYTMEGLREELINIIKRWLRAGGK